MRLDSALEPGGGVRMNDPLLPGPVDKLLGFGEGLGSGIRIRQAADRLDGGAELAPLPFIDGGTGLGLAHLFLG